ncbi:MAG: 4Fe-4S dicluster domain-containing protein [Planctomycetales bacterium]|nr:4Fe-4S dicluster domain-containing protein [Planctomycetales bacterium]
MNDKGKGRWLNRRDLLRGRLWKARMELPLIRRYPVARSTDETDPSAEDLGNRTIAGISIDPVPSLEIKTSRPTAVPIFRPPGAIEEKQFLRGCTQCNECAKACPHSAIRPLDDRWGPLAGTPTIQADLSACQMCSDYPCITACEPKVLSREIPVVMGTAVITEHLCLAYHGSICSACRERCPVANAIEVTSGKPKINEDVCTGCGVCRFVCPAPENAVLLMPTFHRPTPLPS